MTNDNTNTANALFVNARFGSESHDGPWQQGAFEAMMAFGAPSPESMAYCAQSETLSTGTFQSDKGARLYTASQMVDAVTILGIPVIELGGRGTQYKASALQIDAVRTYLESAPSSSSQRSTFQNDVLTQLGLERRLSHRNPVRADEKRTKITLEMSPEARKRLEAIGFGLYGSKVGTTIAWGLISQALASHGAEVVPQDNLGECPTPASTTDAPDDE